MCRTTHPNTTTTTLYLPLSVLSAIGRTVALKICLPFILQHQQESYQGQICWQCKKARQEPERNGTEDRLSDVTTIFPARIRGAKFEEECIYPKH